MMVLLDMVFCVTVAAVVILMAVGTGAAAAFVTVSLVAALKDLLNDLNRD